MKADDEESATSPGDDARKPETRPAPATRLPAAIWTLGFVSLLMDISSEMIHSLLPVFLVSSLAASAFTVGLIEGTAEATALIVKLFSGGGPTGCGGASRWHCSATDWVRCRSRCSRWRQARGGCSARA